MKIHVFSLFFLVSFSHVFGAAAAASGGAGNAEGGVTPICASGGHRYAYPPVCHRFDPAALLISHMKLALESDSDDSIDAFPEGSSPHVKRGDKRGGERMRSPLASALPALVAPKSAVLAPEMIDIYVTIAQERTQGHEDFLATIKNILFRITYPKTTEEFAEILKTILKERFKEFELKTLELFAFSLLSEFPIFVGAPLSALIALAQKKDEIIVICTAEYVLPKN